jgi:hypothetical protein
MSGIIADIFAPLAAAQAVIGAVESAFMTAAYAAAIPIVAIEFRGITDVIIGLGQAFVGTLESLDIIIPDIFEGIITFGTFLLTNIICLARGIGSLPECIFFYIIDTIIQLIYLPIRVSLWFAYTFLRIDVYSVQDKIWDFVVRINDFVYGIIGFDLVYWPQSVRNKCYNCKRLKVSVMVNKADQLGNDFMNKIAPRIWPGIERVMQGADEIMHPFD